MRKLVSLSIAVLASFALAGAASATISMAIVGSNLAGASNVYNITLSVDASDGVVGYGFRVATTGSFAGGVGSATSALPFPFQSPAGTLALTPCANCTVGNWGAVTGTNGVAATGTYTLGTITLNVGVGNSINVNFGFAGAGILAGTASSTIIPTNLTGITIIPEPTTAGLLGLGLLGLVLAGRRSRA